MNVIEALLHTKLVHLGGVHAGKRVRYRVLITRNYTVLHMGLRNQPKLKRISNSDFTLLDGFGRFLTWIAAHFGTEWDTLRHRCAAVSERNHEG